MSNDHPRPAPLGRMPSGIPGLDVILRGGFFGGSVYMIQGPPGAGKTIFGNHVCCEHVAAGGRALFVTLLTESHDRMIANMQGLEFFDARCVGTSLLYFSAYQALQQGKLKGLLEVLHKVVREHKATLLVIDGLITAGGVAESGIELRRFIHNLQVLVELVGCTTLLLTGDDHSEQQYPQRTMVDGLVQMTFEPSGLQTARLIEVQKFRGSEHVLGRHSFEITDAGIVVHPRTEAVLGRSAERPAQGRGQLPFGIPSLDAMLDGGLRPGSVTIALGSPGSGKTLLGLSYLAAGARVKESGLYFGFFETPGELLRNSVAITADLASHAKRGLIDIVWQPPLELNVDALAEKVIGEVRRREIRRLFIDGIGGFKDSGLLPERSARFFTALCNELRSLGVTTVLSEETRNLFGPEVEIPIDGLAPMLDNVLLLRHVELRTKLRRIISVMKMRFGASDSSLREFSISDKGIEVSSTVASAEDILTGIARGGRRPAAPKKKPRRPARRS